MISKDFLIVSLLVVASPGTGALISLQTGLSRGAGMAVMAALGCTLGIVPHMLAALTGLAAVLSASPAAFLTIKYLGAAYLVYMAWSIWRNQNMLNVQPDTAKHTALSTITHAILANLLNPKLSLFFLAFLPQFVPQNATSPRWLMLELSLVFMLITFIVFAGYGIFAAYVRQKILVKPAILRWTQRIFALSLLALGAKLVIEGS